ncbi:MAG: addiction module antidote protein [Candidatus Gastranaerophilales bacterium]
MPQKNNLVSWNEYMNQALDDNSEAMSYLEVAFEEYQQDGDTRSLMRAIQRVAEAQGGISKLAQQTKLNRQNLYRIFANKTSPRFDTLSKILRALGVTISLKSFCFTPAECAN